MKYPTMRVDGKKIKLDKKIYDWYRKQITSSLTFDSKENNLKLTKKDIQLLSYNAAVMVYHEHKLFV